MFFSTRLILFLSSSLWTLLSSSFSSAFRTPTFFFFFLMTRPPPRSTLFPSPPLFRSTDRYIALHHARSDDAKNLAQLGLGPNPAVRTGRRAHDGDGLVPQRVVGKGPRGPVERVLQQPDRKSTRLNSSHSQISYAVSCL